MWPPVFTIVTTTVTIGTIPKKSLIEEDLPKTPKWDEDCLVHLGANCQNKRETTLLGHEVNMECQLGARTVKMFRLKVLVTDPETNAQCLSPQRQFRHMCLLLMPVVKDDPKSATSSNFHHLLHSPFLQMTAGLDIWRLWASPREFSYMTKDRLLDKTILLLSNHA